MLEFTYPPGSSDIPIAAWETKATLNLKDLPRQVSICSSVFLKSFAADAGAFFSFFQIVDEEGKRFAAMEYEAGSIGESWVRVMLGRHNDKNEARIKAKKKLPIFFAQSWVRGCVTLEPSTGLARIVVDGKVLEDAVHPKLKFFATKMRTNGTLQLGIGAGINCIYSDLNIFSETLSLKRMVAITTSGGSECGAQGDFLNWAEAEWKLSDKWASGKWADWVLVVNATKVKEIEWMNGPCWRESKIKVYQLDNIHDHALCMKHCKKISGGRSPSVATEKDWVWLVQEVEAISTQNQEHCHLWLAATEGDSGEFYFHQLFLTYAPFSVPR